MKVHREFAHSNNPEFLCQESVLILPFGRNSYLPAIIQRFDAEPAPLDETTDREVYTIHNSSTNITLIFSGMGAPAMVNALEMVKNNEGKKAVLFGACGGTSPNIQIGDLIIPKGAVRGEGASRYYTPIEFPAVNDKVSALFFCTDNTTLIKETDQKYKGLGDERVRRGFETGLDIVIQVLSQSFVFCSCFPKVNLGCFWSNSSFNSNVFIFRYI